MDKIVRDDNGNWWFALPETATVYDLVAAQRILYGEDEREVE